MVELIEQHKGVGSGRRLDTEGEHRVAGPCRSGQQVGVGARVKGRGIRDCDATAFQTQRREAISGEGVTQRLVRAGLEQRADIAAGQYDFPGHVARTARDAIAGACVSYAFYYTVFVHCAGKQID